MPYPLPTQGEIVTLISCDNRLTMISRTKKAIILWDSEKHDPLLGVPFYLQPPGAKIVTLYGDKRYSLSKCLKYNLIINSLSHFRMLFLDSRRIRFWTYNQVATVDKSFNFQN